MKLSSLSVPASQWPTLSLLLSICFSWMGGCTSPSSFVKDKEEAFFVAKVKPVLEYYCIECHIDKDAPLYAGFSMETGRSAMTTGRHAPVIRPGNPDESLLLIVLRLGHEEVLGMPPAPDKILDAELAAIRRWILRGAHWPEGEKGRLVLPH